MFKFSFTCEILTVFLGIILQESKSNPDEFGLVWEENIGSGSYGIVSKCTKNGEMVAVKEINKNNYQEVTILQKLKHPNIVNLKEIIEKEKSFLLVMYLYSGSLEGLLNLRLRKKSIFPT